MTNIFTGKNLTPKEAASRIGVSHRTMADWRSYGIGPSYIKTSPTGRGGRVLYPESSIEDYLEAQIVRNRIQC